MPKHQKQGHEETRGSARSWRTAATLVIAVLVTFAALIIGAVPAQAQQPEGADSISSVEADFAIKEVLLITAEKAVARGSAVDGFAGNVEIRISLPGGLRTGEETLRRFGLSQEIDNLLLSLNRAAEQSAGQALPALLEAIRETEMGDAQALLSGKGNAATRSFQAAAEQRLVERLTPVAGMALEQSAGMTAFRALVEHGGDLMSRTRVSEEDLAPHVATGTVRGLLALMAEQELAIRQDPAARVTPLMRKVFGSAPAESVTVTETPAADEQAPAVEEDERRQALTEALLVAGLRAVERASQDDGYWGNEEIRIPLPEKLRKAGSRLRDLGLGSLVDELELSINRAAEQAAAEAASIISDAVRNTTFKDVVKILTGGETAATDALRAKTEDKLTEVLRPVIDAKMQETGVTRHYDKLVERAGPVLQLLGLGTEADLPAYVTAQALDGLFTLLAEEEAKIRKDPVARTTELLRRIFGSLD